LADLQTMLADLRAAYYVGATSIQYEGKSITYRDGNEMRAAIASLEKQLGVSSSGATRVIEFGRDIIDGDAASRTSEPTSLSRSRLGELEGQGWKAATFNEVSTTICPHERDCRESYDTVPGEQFAISVRQETLRVECGDAILAGVA
jgi:hypothetical protein